MLRMAAGTSWYLRNTGKSRSISKAAGLNLGNAAKVEMVS